MLVHIVLWRLKQEAQGRDKDQNAQLMVRELEALPGKISEIITLKTGINYNTSDAAWDVALFTEFASREHLAVYQQHPDHVNVAKLIGELTAERAVVDYEK